MNLSKDTYEYLMNFADDKDIINMLSVNQKFNDPVFFRRVMERKYPLLIDFKKEDESWRRFFVKMVFYITKLKERFGILYIPLKDYNPEEFYMKYKKSSFALYFALEIAVAGGKNYDVVQIMLDELFEMSKSDILKFNYIISLNDLLEQAVESGDLNMVKLLVKNGVTDFANIFQNASVDGDLNILKYALSHKDKISRDFIEDALILSRTNKHPEIEKYLTEYLN